MVPSIEVFPTSYKYEITITFNPKYYPLGKACNSIDLVIRDVEKAFHRYTKAYKRENKIDVTNTYISNNIAYCVEYFKAREEGQLHYPHIHMLIQSVIDLDATKIIHLRSNVKKEVW